MSGYERFNLTAELVGLGIDLETASAIATHGEVHSVDDAYDMLSDLKGIEEVAA